MKLEEVSTLELFEELKKRDIIGDLPEDIQEFFKGKAIADVSQLAVQSMESGMSYSIKYLLDTPVDVLEAKYQEHLTRTQKYKN